MQTRHLISIPSVPKDVLYIIEEYASLPLRITARNLVTVYQTKKPRRKRGRSRSGWFDFHLSTSSGWMTCLEFYSPIFSFESKQVQEVICKSKNSIGIELGTLGYGLRYNSYTVPIYRQRRSMLEGTIWIKMEEPSKEPPITSEYWTETDQLLPHLLLNDVILCFFQEDSLQLFLNWLRDIRASLLPWLQLKGIFNPCDNSYTISEVFPDVIE